MALCYYWYPLKAEQNLRERDISFTEGAGVLKYDPLSLTRPDHEHSEFDDERFVTIGRSLRSRTLIVVHSDTVNGCTRIISVREATSRERYAYERDE